MIYSRADWQAAPPLEPPAPSGPGDSLVVHHSAGPVPATPEEAFALLRDIQAMHQSSGYLDIAYSCAVDNAGNLYDGRGMAYLPAATYGENDHTKAVVWLGNSETAAVSDAALRAIAALYRAEIGSNLQAGASITGHRDWVATACPGAGLYAALPTIRAYAADPPPDSDEDDPMMRTMRTPDGTVLLVDRLNYRVMPGSWPDVEAAIRAMVAARTVEGEPDGSPRLYPITAAGVAALVRL